MFSKYTWNYTLINKYYVIKSTAASFDNITSLCFSLHVVFHFQIISCVSYCKCLATNILESARNFHWSFRYLDSLLFCGTLIPKQQEKKYLSKLKELLMEKLHTHMHLKVQKPTPYHGQIQQWLHLSHNVTISVLNKV